MTVVDFYAVLGVRRNATLAEVRRAYQKRARQIHPDLNPGDPAAAERFRVVSEAFAVLADAQRRAEYDRGGFGRARGGLHPRDRLRRLRLLGRGPDGGGRVPGDPGRRLPLARARGEGRGPRARTSSSGRR